MFSYAHWGDNLFYAHTQGHPTDDGAIRPADTRNDVDPGVEYFVNLRVHTQHYIGPFFSSPLPGL